MVTAAKTTARKPTAMVPMVPMVPSDRRSTDRKKDTHFSAEPFKKFSSREGDVADVVYLKDFFFFFFSAEASLAPLRSLLFSPA